MHNWSVGLEVIRSRGPDLGLSQMNKSVATSYTCQLVCMPLSIRMQMQFGAVSVVFVNAGGGHQPDLHTFLFA